MLRMLKEINRTLLDKLGCRFYLQTVGNCYRTVPMQYEKYFLSLLYFATYFTSFWASGIIVKLGSKEENIHHSTRHSVTAIVKYFLIFLTDAKTGSTNLTYLH